MLPTDEVGVSVGDTVDMAHDEAKPVVHLQERGKTQEVIQLHVSGTPAGENGNAGGRVAVDYEVAAGGHGA